MRLHAFDADLCNLIDAHAQHLTSLQNQRPVALCSELLVLPLFHEALEIHIHNSIRAHACRGLDNAAQFINYDPRNNRTLDFDQIFRPESADSLLSFVKEKLCRQYYVESIDKLAEVSGIFVSHLFF